MYLYCHWLHVEKLHAQMASFNGRFKSSEERPRISMCDVKDVPMVLRTCLRKTGERTFVIAGNTTGLRDVSGNSPSQLCTKIEQLKDIAIRITPLHCNRALHLYTVIEYYTFTL